MNVFCMKLCMKVEELSWKPVSVQLIVTSLPSSRHLFLRIETKLSEDGVVTECSGASVAYPSDERAVLPLQCCLFFAAIHCHR